MSVPSQIRSKAARINIFYIVYARPKTVVTGLHATQHLGGKVLEVINSGANIVR